MKDKNFSRRDILIGSIGIVGLGALSYHSIFSNNTLKNNKATLGLNEMPKNQNKYSLTAQKSTVELDGKILETWTFNNQIPGPIIRGKIGEPLTVTIKNNLPEDTSIHWHGLHVPNDQDGVPGVTQDGIKPGESFTYTFTPTNAGTHFYHPHSGFQLDMGLYAPIIIDDPKEKSDCDKEFIILLDDWLDGINGNTPEKQYQKLLNGEMTHGNHSKEDMSMDDMDHSKMGNMNHAHLENMSGMNHSPMQKKEIRDLSKTHLGNAFDGDLGDVMYPLYLINGKTKLNPEIFKVEKNQKIKFRVINAGGDTTFKLAIENHKLKITHTDGYPTKSKITDSFLISMGERYDFIVETKEDGNFSFIAEAIGKNDIAKAVFQVGDGNNSSTPDSIPEMEGNLTTINDLESIYGDDIDFIPDTTIKVVMGGQMMPYKWTINGATMDDKKPIMVEPNQKIRMELINDTDMAHPVHVHGHTWTLPNNSGLKKDTIFLPEKTKIIADLQTNNKGKWALHCHNLYHMAAGMMTTMDYTNF